MIKNINLIKSDFSKIEKKDIDDFYSILFLVAIYILIYFLVG